MRSFLTLKSPDVAPTEVAVVQHIQPPPDGSWKAGELLTELHCSLDENPLLHSEVSVSATIFMQGVSNVLSFLDPRKIVFIQLDMGQICPAVTVESYTHGLALLGVNVSAEHQTVLLGMLLADVDHLL